MNLTTMLIEFYLGYLNKSGTNLLKTKGTTHGVAMVPNWHSSHTV